MSGLLIDKKNDKIDCGDYSINLKRHAFGNAQGLVGVDVGEKTKAEEITASYIVIQIAKDEFIMARGVGSSVINMTKSATSKFQNVGYASVYEIIYENGVTKTHRLNGDETAFGGPVAQFGEVKVFKIKMYNY